MLAGFHDLFSVHSSDKSSPRKSFSGIIAYTSSTHLALPFSYTVSDIPVSGVNLFKIACLEHSS